MRYLLLGLIFVCAPITAPAASRLICTFSSGSDVSGPIDTEIKAEVIFRESDPTGVVTIGSDTIDVSVATNSRGFTVVGHHASEGETDLVTTMISSSFDGTGVLSRFAFFDVERLYAYQVYGHCVQP